MLLTELPSRTVATVIIAVSNAVTAAGARSTIRHRTPTLLPLFADAQVMCNAP